MSTRPLKKALKMARYAFLFGIGFVFTFLSSGRSSNGSLLSDVNELIRIPIASADIPVGDSSGGGDTGSDSSGGDRDGGDAGCGGASDSGGGGCSSCSGT